MNDAFPQRIHYAEAVAIVTRVAAARRLPVEELALSRSLGRVLAALERQGHGLEVIVIDDQSSDDTRGAA